MLQLQDKTLSALLLINIGLQRQAEHNSVYKPVTRTTVQKGGRRQQHFGTFTARHNVAKIKASS